MIDTYFPFSAMGYTVIFYITILLVILSHLSLSIDTNDQKCRKYGYNNSNLEMDISWIMQGREIQFQGFFVEFLGFAESLISLNPFLKLVKSSYRQSLDEPIINKPTKFYQDLFPKERGIIQNVISSDFPSVNFTSSPKFSYFSEKLSSFSDICNPSTFRSEMSLIGGDLSKGKIKGFTIQSEMDCCKYCYDSSLCLAWEYNIDSKVCSLKSDTKTILQKPSQGSISGFINSEDEIQRIRRPKALIFHGTSCFHSNVSASIGRDPNNIYIGRYMFERSVFSQGLNIDEYSVSYCSGLMDEIWIPTEWHKEVFTKLLMSQWNQVPRLYVIPEAVDTTLFNPHENYPQENSAILSSSSDITVTENWNSHKTVLKNCSLDNISKNIKCNNGQHFEFLSIFKWEYRKGWDVLLSAYWKAFKPFDDVILRIRTYLPSSEYGNSNITFQIESFARKEFSSELKDLARVEWISGVNPDQKSDSMSREQVRDLYARSDAFVLPTRGEGWGLPISEAMAMELPVIVTNHSGPTAFAFENNSYLLDIESEYDSLFYAKPKVGKLIDLFHQVILDSSESHDFKALIKGKQARETMKYFNSDMITCMINDRLRYHALRRGWIFP